MKDLKDYRDEINQIDEEMADLFTRRMEAVRGIAEYKKSHGLAIEDHAREQEVIERRSEFIDDPELRSFYVQFLRYNMKVSKRYQHLMMYGQRIAFSPVRDDTGLAAVQALYPDSEHVPFQSYGDAYNAVVKGDCNIAVIPFEVSYAGEVSDVLNLMYLGPLYVNEVYNHKADNETTRYAVLSKVDNKLSNDATLKNGSAFMLMFTVKDETGGLAKAVNVISAYDFNMRTLRSRPMPDIPWHYYFFAEVIGDDTSENGKRMLNALKVVCPNVKVVGRYKI